MASHPSILAWRIPWTEEPGGLQSTGSQRVGHDWATEHTLSQMKLDHMFFFFLVLLQFWYLGSVGIKKGLSTLPCLMYLFCSLWGYLCKKYVISKAWVEACVTLRGCGHTSSGGKVTVGKRRGLCWVWTKDSSVILRLTQGVTNPCSRPIPSSIVLIFCNLSLS